MGKFVANLWLTVTLALFISFTPLQPTMAANFHFTWYGDRGYAATGSFSYDENQTSGSFSESGAGKTQVLQSLGIFFFDYRPQNRADASVRPLASYQNVANGVAKGQFFKFNFNPATRQIFGEIDLGGGLPGETYLSGTVDRQLSWFNVPESGKDVIIDSNSGLLTVEVTSDRQ